MLCHHALKLLMHGLTPQTQPQYPTAEESKNLHNRLRSEVKRIVDESLASLELEGVTVLSSELEYEHTLGFRSKDATLCANSKADLVYTLKARVKGDDGKIRESLVTFYVETTTRFNVAKPWQALLRGLALYYERRLPVWIAVISPESLKYKQLSEKDQDEVLRRVRGEWRGHPSPSLCSLCELVHFCPEREI